MFLINILSILVDFILMLGGLFFNVNTGLQLPFWGIIFIIAVTVIFFKRKKNYADNFLVKFCYVLLILFSVDTMFLMDIALIGWSWFAFLLPLVFYIIILKFRQVKYLQWNKLQCLIVPFVMVFLLCALADLPQSRSACQLISTQKNVKVLTDLNFISANNRIRYLLELKDATRFLVSYRKGITSPVNDLATLDLIDVKNKKKEPWISSKDYEVIGLAKDYQNNVYVIIVKAGFGTGCKKNNSCAYLIKFSEEGKIKIKLPIANSNQGEYAASIFPFKKKVLVVMDNNLYLYNPQKNNLKLLKEKNNLIVFEALKYKSYIYGVFAHSPLFVMSPAVIRFNLKTLKIDKTFNKSLLGYYALKKIGNKGNFMVNNLWGGGGLIFDFNLQVIKKINIPWGVRSFGLDKKGKYLLAPNFFTGEMQILNIENNKFLAEKYFVGKGARLVSTDEKDNILIGTSCGIIEIKSAVFNEK